MSLTPELIFAMAVAAIAFLAGVLYFRLHPRRTRSVGRVVSRQPANLRFTCKGCSQEFTHSRQTLNAWQKGTRQFFCKACHTKRLHERPPDRSAQVKRR
ncbi:MAG: hypothetical protein ABI605_15185 [Rhizobacter sp.]